jgi:hypothetical protein
MIKLVDNIDTTVREYLSNNGLLKKDGSVYKSVTVNNINYTFAGSHYVHNAKNVIHKNNNIIFIKNTINVSKSELDNGLHSFGDAKLVLDGVSYNNSRFTDGETKTVVELSINEKHAEDGFCLIGSKNITHNDNTNSTIDYIVNAMSPTIINQTEHKKMSLGDRAQWLVTRAMIGDICNP